MLALGRAQARLGDGEGARAAVLRALAAARQRGPFARATPAARELVRSRRFALAVLELGSVGLPPGGSDEEVVALLEEALALAADVPPALHARVLARLAVQLYWTGDPERIAQLTAEAR